jgi:L-fuconolactonase
MEGNMAEKHEFRGNSYRHDAALNRWIARARREQALEPDLPIIDPHHHLWDDDRGPYLLPHILADIGGGHNVRATVFIECRANYRADGPEAMRPVGEAEFVNGISAMSASGGYGPCRVAAAIVGHADLRLGEKVHDVLEAEIAVTGGRLRGIRWSIPYDASEVGKYVSRYVAPGISKDATWRAGFSRLAKLGLSFEGWCYHPQIPEITDLAKAFPDTTIILNHVGGMLGVGPYAERKSDVFAEWQRSIRELAKCPNVVVKLGGLGMLIFGFDLHTRDTPPSSEVLASTWKPFIETCIEAFGVDRCMYESNFPVDKQSCDYTACWNAFKRLSAGASAAEKAALFSGTAGRVYRIAI